jgi:hypothetical protein
MPGDLAIVSPLQDRITGELGAVVAHDHVCPTVLDEQPVELASDPDAGDRRIGDQHSRLQSSTTTRMRRRRPSMNWSAAEVDRDHSAAAERSSECASDGSEFYQEFLASSIAPGITMPKKSFERRSPVTDFWRRSAERVPGTLRNSNSQSKPWPGLCDNRVRTGRSPLPPHFCFRICW